MTSMANNFNEPCDLISSLLFSYGNYFLHFSTLFLFKITFFSDFYMVFKEYIKGLCIMYAHPYVPTTLPMRVHV